MEGKKVMPRIGNSLHRKFLGLLDMVYKPSELAEILNLSAKTIYKYVEQGLPVRKDRYGHIWINGKALAGWGKSMLSTGRKVRLVGKDDFYCLGCKAAVHQEVYTARRSRRVMLLKGVCPVCGTTITKFVRREG